MPQIVQSALEGSRGQDQQRIAATAMDCLRLLLQKNHDYGCSVWKVPRFAPDCSVGAAILVRLTDKVERLERLAGMRAEVADESFDDTMRDLIGYSTLWLARPIMRKNVQK